MLVYAEQIFRYFISIFNFHISALIAYNTYTVCPKNNRTFWI